MKIISVIISIIVAIGVIIIVLSLYTSVDIIPNRVSELQETVDSLQSTIIRHGVDIFLVKLKTEDLKTYGSIDLSHAPLQTIDYRFLITIESVTEHLTGIKIKGRIVNLTSLRFDNLKFNITIASQSKEFSIRRISSGNSTTFNVYVPNVPLEESQYAYIEFVESLIYYGQ